MKRKGIMKCVANRAHNTIVRALYPYASQEAGELSLQPGDILTLAPGGESYGNGWWEGKAGLLALKRGALSGL